ncbi:hypothetical protein SSP35_29_00080 [Streptomyces sp. NBRC 110611]|nr:hypothetical protein SSP35_29_00080 [Streptomyces sp. NBRC 110611]
MADVRVVYRYRRYAVMRADVTVLRRAVAGARSRGAAEGRVWPGNHSFAQVVEVRRRLGGLAVEGAAVPAGLTER